jgi:hypothetical protein
MTDVTNPTGETPAAQPQAAVQSEAVVPPTQPAEAEEFDKERAMKLINNLREVEKQAKKEAKELQELRAEKQKRSEAEMTELQRFQKQAEELQAQNAKLQSDLIRSKVIQEVNLPSIFADRLQGSNYEEMLADAKKILEVLPKQTTTKTAPTLNATNPANGQITETDAQMRERLFGKQGNVFDPNIIKAGGGGVVWIKPPEQP